MFNTASNIPFKGVRSHSQDSPKQLPENFICNDLSVINNANFNSLLINSVLLNNSVRVIGIIVGTTLTTDKQAIIVSFDVPSIANDGSSIIYSITNPLITTQSVVLVNIQNYSASSGDGIPQILTNVYNGSVDIILYNVNPTFGSVLIGNITFSIVILGLSNNTMIPT